jgi:TPR repeat protein
MSGRRVHRLLCLVALTAAGAGHGAGQKSPDSPVFRSYKSAEEKRPIIRPSDPLAELWTTFLLARRAEAGDILAMHDLGARYFVGLGAVPDTMLAAYWIGKAASGGVTRAGFHLAILAYHGWGVEWNPFEAFRLADAAAARNLPDAQYMLSVLYLEDLIVPSDPSTALAWAEKAVRGGYRPAADLVGRIKEFLKETSADTVVRNDTVARGGKSFLPILVDFGPDSAEGPGATSGLVRSLSEGTGPELRQALGLARLLDSSGVSDSAAIARVSLSAEAGSPEALALLGRWYELGTGVPRDRVRACGYYVRAIRMGSPRAPELLERLAGDSVTVMDMKRRASAGDPEARFAWAGMLGVGMEGLLVRHEAYLVPAQALEFLRSGAAQGYLPATVELGLCHFAGRWVPVDPAKAVEIWEGAAKQGSREATIRLAVVRLREHGDSAQAADAMGVLFRASAEGSVLADVALGYCAEQGIGREGNLTEAVRLYREAARRGSPDGFRALKRLHDSCRPPDPRFQVEG